MTAHIVLPARRSAVPGQLVRQCTAPGCGWVAHSADPDELRELAREHHEQATEPDTEVIG